MTRIALICMGGFSSSVLVQKMEESAKKQNLEVQIRAMSEGNFKKYADQTDIVLLGPQVSFIEQQVKERYSHLKVAVINSIDYGTMNGEKVLKDALKL
ncbi:PTS sugar transporter subunit IIB [Acetonema longum]|uniref:Phosphotransferase system lactose/cellobiose-specific iib subunit n=1 Tax=Acetonema longum DSM 6540 TaxID=1009370 RepID=F7NFX6_9FIRM|nr:PTS sugar transporter subunit IIB [Acetonema longum]EGO65039.1 phosphotransferase system lactose/cellobiose-specific iib subunit [Acetonema longum DSM 6540]